MPTPNTFPQKPTSKRVERSLVHIDRDSAGVRVIFSMASAKGSANRARVLERARRMLAAAIEEEQRRAVPADSAAEDERSAGRGPGNGAWWCF